MEFLILLESGKEIYFSSTSNYENLAMQEAEKFASRYDVNRGYDFTITLLG
jgi:hypothetical protein